MARREARHRLKDELPAGPGDRDLRSTGLVGIRVRGTGTPGLEEGIEDLDHIRRAAGPFFPRGAKHVLEPCDTGCQDEGERKGEGEG